MEINGDTDQLPTVVTPPQSHLKIHMARNPHQVLYIGLMVKISTRLFCTDINERF